MIGRIRGYYLLRRVRPRARASAIAYNLNRDKFLNSARTLEHQIDTLVHRARTSSESHNSGIALDRVRTFALTLDQAGRKARAIDLKDDARGLIDGLEQTLGVAAEIARTCDEAFLLILEGDRALARRLTQDLTRLRDLLAQLVHVLENNQDRRERLADDLVRVLSNHNLGRDLQRTSNRVYRYVAAREPQARVSDLSRLLTRLAAQMLPASDRSSFEEEFQSDLYNMPFRLGRRRAQTAYAVRVLLRAPLLRRELRAPAPSKRERHGD